MCAFITSATIYRPSKPASKPEIANLEISYKSRSDFDVASPQTQALYMTEQFRDFFPKKDMPKCTELAIKMNSARSIVS